MPVAVLKRGADPDVVQALKDALAKAEAGEIAEVVIVANCPGDNAFWQRVSFSDRWRILGALAWAQANIGRDDAS